MEAPPLTEEEYNQLYNWIDSIPLTRQKKNITRDFADGCMMAEIIHHYLPKLVEVHNYSQAHSMTQKLYNWNTLNFFRRMGFQISNIDIDNIVNCVPNVIERVMKVVQIKIEKFIEEQKKKREQEIFIQQRQQQNALQIQQSNQGGGLSQQQQQNFNDPNSYVYNNMNVKDLINKLHEKDQQIQELKETTEILELKVKKMDQLIKLKDSKIQNLVNKLSSAGIQ